MVGCGGYRLPRMELQASHSVLACGGGGNRSFPSSSFRIEHLEFSDSPSCHNLLLQLKWWALPGCVCPYLLVFLGHDHGLLTLEGMRHRGNPVHSSLHCSLGLRGPTSLSASFHLSISLFLSLLLFY